MRSTVYDKQYRTQDGSLWDATHQPGCSRLVGSRQIGLNPPMCDVTDAKQDYANSRSYCVAVRSAKNTPLCVVLTSSQTEHRCRFHSHRDDRNFNFPALNAQRAVSRSTFLASIDCVAIMWVFFSAADGDSSATWRTDGARGRNGHHRMRSYRSPAAANCLAAKLGAYWCPTTNHCHH